MIRKPDTSTDSNGSQTGVLPGGYPPFRYLVYLICSDLYRYDGRLGVSVFLRHLLWGVGSKKMIWVRVTTWLGLRGPLFRPLFMIGRLVNWRLGLRYGISISWRTTIGPGFYVGHYGCIFVSPDAIIGRNCNISQGVTIGSGSRGKTGVPVIGDDVYLGPGAKLFGGIRVGDNVAVGANAVVSRHVKSNSIVTAGTPGIIRCSDPFFPIYGSRGYVIRTDYTDRLRRFL